MTARDRLVLIGIVVLVVLAGGWLLVVSPERKSAAQAQAQVESAHQQLETAQAQATSARSAQQRYTAAYSSVVSLGKAVPPQEEVPSLIYELNHASHQRDVEFSSITTSATGSSGSATPTAGTASAAAGAAPAAFTQMPFTFVFKGSFEGLSHLLGEIDGFAVRTNAGGVVVSGRLLTVQGADITLESQSSPTSGSKNTPLSATITATAYVLPTSQGLTAGATSSGPSGLQSSASSGSASSPTTPAVVKVTP
jgi:Type II secretion system (T2SS), protein M